MKTLFLGTYTIGWGKAEFVGAWQYAQSLGFDRLAVKVADGGNVWYGGISQGAALLAGLPVIPFIFSYGDRFSALDREMAIAKQCLVSYGDVIVDMESEWDGQTAWATRWVAGMGGKKHALTTWANIGDHRWTDLVDILSPCVSEWIPQAYYNLLYTKMLAQWDMRLPFAPALCVIFPGEQNAFVQMCAAIGKASRPLYVWEYHLAQQQPGLVQQGVHAYMQVQQPTQAQITSAGHEWNSFIRCPMNTGIFAAWLAMTCSGKRPGPPITQEYQSVDWNGSTITVQEFAHCRCEWDPRVNTARWFDARGEL